MPIEEDIRKALERLIFNKKLPEFIDRAKYLEERLEEGEHLLIKIGKLETFDPTLYIVYNIFLELHTTKGKPRKVITIDPLGDLKYRNDLFKGYRPLPESQKER